MTSPDVLRCTYSDLKTVKTRSTCQLILELPIEALTDVVALLGAPVPGNEVWVAVARLMTEAELERGIEALAPPHKPKSLAQIAGIVCNEPAFWKYIRVKGADEAAEYVRGHCGVTSRAALDSNEDAANAFRTLKADYIIWRDGLAA
jgi:hypothetical protein